LRGAVYLRGAVSLRSAVWRIAQVFFIIKHCYC
jgi:hypothetical protein